VLTTDAEDDKHAEPLDQSDPLLSHTLEQLSQAAALRRSSEAALATSEPAPADRVPQASAARIRSLDGLRILVVDDDRDAVDMLGTLLESYGATVATCGSAGEAFATLQSMLPDLLISDIGMPTEDGYRLIERVRLLPEQAGGTTRAIALTAFARAQDRVRALASGFQAHVAKPVQIQELVALIGRVTDRNATA
jgi:CheY-like chemotaxis protein